MLIAVLLAGCEAPDYVPLLREPPITAAVLECSASTGDVRFDYSVSELARSDAYVFGDKVGNLLVIGLVTEPTGTRERRAVFDRAEPDHARGPIRVGDWRLSADRGEKAFLVESDAAELQGECH